MSVKSATVTPPSSEFALDAAGLTFAYGKDKPLVLDIPTFQLKRGERMFLHGASGSGKTTLLGLLAGILTPKSGRVTVLGTDFQSFSGASRDHFRGAHVGYIFQMFNLIPYLDVKNNIMLPLSISQERRARVKGSPEGEARLLAEHLGIDNLFDQPVTELSVGQQQRVAAARALIGSPEIIIADEPTSALDTDRRESFLKVMFAAAERAGSSVLFVSHDHTLKPLFSRVQSLGEINRAASKSAAGGGAN